MSALKQLLRSDGQAKRSLMSRSSSAVSRLWRGISFRRHRAVPCFSVDAAEPSISLTAPWGHAKQNNGKFHVMVRGFKFLSTQFQFLIKDLHFGKAVLSSTQVLPLHFRLLRSGYLQKSLHHFQQCYVFSGPFLSGEHGVEPNNPVELLCRSWGPTIMICIFWTRNASFIYRLQWQIVRGGYGSPEVFYLFTEPGHVFKIDPWRYLICGLYSLRRPFMGVIN